MPDDATQRSKRCLILGFPRSGTTLLSQLLDAHERISSPPETNLFSAMGRFLAEQSHVEGPPIGVLAGLGFLGVDEEEIYAPLRQFVFAMHERVAEGADYWIEKTATDIFHVDALEPMLAGHARFIILLRNPLDVVASNCDLADAMGAQLVELREITRHYDGPHEGFAYAWVEAISRLMAFVSRNEADCHVMRYEDLLAAPEVTLGKLLEFLHLPPDAAEMIAASFAKPRRIGLGDFRIHESSAIRPPIKNGWRKRIPPAAARRVVDIVGPLMAELGYDVPRMPQLPDRQDAIRQFVLSARMKRSQMTANS